ncbi:MAG: glycosyl transferase-like protein [Porticoccaceae bacterium]|nr:glycosyl transferase-like protein [Porticoccaceae bacterium]
MGEAPYQSLNDLSIPEMPVTAAIYFHPEGYSTRGPKLMGRNAAGESFLRGFLRHSQTERFWAQVPRRGFGKLFAEAVRAEGRNEPVSVVDRANRAHLRQVGMVYYPGPGIGQHAWERAAFGHAGWSLCGITHTTSSAGAMDSIAELLMAPVQPWDAVICTSTAVKDNVERVLASQEQYLRERMGAARIPRPQLPVIPLGIHVDDFQFSEQEKLLARERLGAGPGTHVVLFMGRLSFHAKAHPLAMYQALERAASSLPAGENVLLVECGWHGNEPIAQAFRDGAAMACPSVRVITLDGRVAEERQRAWAAADVLCSLADNIQETFGIVPIEGMAAGLPVVVSDWDGYRDTVRDGVDGFRIPTAMPSRGHGGDLALRHAFGMDTYDMYCGHTCSVIAVDVEATARVFSRLFASPALRRELGVAGRQRAREVYDWSVIIPQYEALWKMQRALRQEAGADAHRPVLWPARMDPFDGFAAYPTTTLDHNTTLALAFQDAGSACARVEQLRTLRMVEFAAYVLPSSEEVEALLNILAAGPATVSQIGGALGPNRPRHYTRKLGWLLKLGVIRLV